MMPKEYGHVHKPLRGRWQTFVYQGKRNVKIGEYDTRDEAVAALRAHIDGLKGKGA